MFDGISDKDIEDNIQTAENTIQTSIDRGTLSKTDFSKLPNLRDGLALSYAAANKGNSKAATKAREAAYMEDIKPLVDKVKNGLSYELPKIENAVQRANEKSAPTKLVGNANEKPNVVHLSDKKEKTEHPTSFFVKELLGENKSNNHQFNNVSDEQKEYYKIIDDYLDLDLSNPPFKRSGINDTLQILDVINTNINKTANNIIGVKKIVDTIYNGSYNIEKGFPTDNYIHNSKISLDSTGALEGDFIEHQSKLKDYKYGAKDIEYGGCGIIAIYNVLQGLGKPKDFASLIYENENSALLKELLGTSPASIENSLEKHGFNVSSDYSGINEKSKVSDNDAVIHFYFRKDLSAHYVAGISNGDGTFCFYNSDTGKTKPMTWEEYFRDTNEHTNVAYNCIYKIKKKD